MCCRRASLTKVRLRVLVTSRSEVPIRYGVCQIDITERRDFVLHDMDPAIVDDDISIFLRHEMRSIGQEWALGTGWPNEQAFKQLVLNASGLFIWAATACRFIREGREYAAERLSTMLAGSTSILAPEHHLNNVYMKVLESTVHGGYLENEKKDKYLLLKQVLGALVLLDSPLSINSLSKLLCLPVKIIHRGLADLHAILDIPKEANAPLHLHHPSFRDFLLDKDRCSNLHFWVDERQVHQKLATSCIQLMSAFLRRDICGVDAPGTLITDVESSRVEQCLPREVQYACLYWANHFERSGAQLSDNDQVHRFLHEHLLHWLEALSWIERTLEGIDALLSLLKQMPVRRLYNIRYLTRRNLTNLY